MPEPVSASEKPVEGRSEKATWRVHTKVEKWADPAARLRGDAPDDVVEDEGNLLLTAGVNRMLRLFTGEALQAFSNDWARLGVGNGATAVEADDLDLSAAAGAANRWFRPMEDGYPSVTDNAISFRAVFGDGDANFAWNEWGIDLGGAGSATPSAVVGAPLLNRRVPSPNLGTKTGGDWTLTVSITIS